MGYNNYYLYGIILDGCPYSMAAKELLEENIKRHEIFMVSHSNKEDYKNECIETFPQIYLKKYNSDFSELIGGYDEFRKIYDTVKHAKSSKTIKSKVLKLLRGDMEDKKKSGLIISHIILDTK